MAITDADLLSAKPNDTAYCIYDSDDKRNFSACVHTNGEIHWQLEYIFQGQRKFLFLGLYPVIGIMKARRLKNAILNILKHGIDPMQIQKNSNLIIELALEHSDYQNDVQSLCEILLHGSERSEESMPKIVLLGKDPFEKTDMHSSFTENTASRSKSRNASAL